MNLERSYGYIYFWVRDSKYEGNEEPAGTDKSVLGKLNLAVGNPVHSGV